MVGHDTMPTEQTDRLRISFWRVFKNAVSSLSVYGPSPTFAGSRQQIVHQGRHRNRCFVSRLQAMNYRKSGIAILVAVLVGFTAWFGTVSWKKRQWFELQSQQLATIKRLEKFPPAGWDPVTWRNALVTPYNVWGNVTYSPSYSAISNAEMRALQSNLDQIVAEATTENSMECVDRVFAILLHRGWKTQFITGYRDEFRAFHGDSQVRVHRQE